MYPTRVNRTSRSRTSSEPPGPAARSRGRGSRPANRSGSLRRAGWNGFAHFMTASQAPHVGHVADGLFDAPARHLHEVVKSPPTARAGAVVARSPLRQFRQAVKPSQPHLPGRAARARQPRPPARQPVGDQMAAGGGWAAGGSEQAPNRVRRRPVLLGRAGGPG